MDRYLSVPKLSRPSSVASNYSTRPSSVASNVSTRPASVAAYVSTPDQHLASQVQVYPKGKKIPREVENGEKRGFVLARLKTKDAMNSYIAHRVEHTTDRAFFTLKEDLIVIAKQKAFELNANAIINAKLSITKEWKYGRWYKMAGYIHGTAIYTPPDPQFYSEANSSYLDSGTSTPGSMIPISITPIEEESEAQEESEDDDEIAVNQEEVEEDEEIDNST